MYPDVYADDGEVAGIAAAIRRAFRFFYGKLTFQWEKFHFACAVCQ
jgi:hypothetical protein